MRLKSLFLISLFSVVFVLGVMAKPVTPEGAKKVAARFLSLYSTNDALRVDELIAYQLENEITGYYFVKLDPIGWVMVSGDDRLKPVIGYSFNSEFVPKEEWEESALTWLSSLDDEIIYSVKRHDLDRNAEWDRIFEESYKKTAVGEEVEPIIDVRWGQGNAYNRYCPESETVPGGKAVVGCVAVAMAQAMSAYKHPDQPTGNFGYRSENYGYLQVKYDEEEPYNWVTMDSIRSDEENARLLYHAAVSVEMDFSPDGSGAHTFTVPGAMRKHFGYSSKANFRRRADYEVEEWHTMITDELRQGRPLIYSGSEEGEAGHAFNVDGVGADGTYFHLNWGWSGTANGYYTLNHLVPLNDNGSIVGGDFTYNGGAVFELRPAIPGPYDISLSNNTIVEKQDSGSFVGVLEIEDEFESNVYTFELKGAYDPITREHGPAKFYIENDSLRSTEVFNHDEATTEFLRIEVTDTAGTSYTEDFEIRVDKFYVGPTSLSLVNSDVKASTKVGSFIGAVRVEDDIEDNTYTYICNGGYDVNDLNMNGFKIQNNALFTNQVFDPADGDLYYLAVELTDVYEHTLFDTLEINIIDDINGVNEAVNGRNLRVFPNPASEFLTIDMDEDFSVRKASLQIINMQGQTCIYRPEVSGSTIDISCLENGMYIIILNNGNYILREKLLKSD